MKQLISGIKKIKAERAERQFRASLIKRDKWMVDKFNLPELTADELRLVRETWPFVQPTNDDLIWNRMYKSVHGFDPYFVSDYQVQPIYRALNPSVDVEFLKDKALIDIYCPELAFPHTYIKCVNGLLHDVGGNVITEAEVTKILEASGQQEYIVKPSRDTGCGKGVRKVGGVKDALEAMRDAGQNYIVQECLRQCDFLNRLNATSINTCRVTSLYIDGKSSLSSVLKVGKKDAAIDNWNSSYFMAVDHQGRLGEYAYDDRLNKVQKSDLGVSFGGLLYPGFQEIEAFVEHYHKKYFPTLGILGWDIFIDNHHKIRTIEINPDYPGVKGAQFCTGTFFKQHRDRIVNRIIR